MKEKISYLDLVKQALQDQKWQQQTQFQFKQASLRNLIFFIK
jgi:hypothetical protein